MKLLWKNNNQKLFYNNKTIMALYYNLLKIFLVVMKIIKHVNLVKKNKNKLII